MEKVLKRASSRPAFVSAGFSFRIKQKFIFTETLELLSFEWHIKCREILPPISLTVVKVSYGSGHLTKDLSSQFVFPDKMIFPETKRLPKERSAQIHAQCNLKIIDRNMPYGMYRVLVEMEFRNTVHRIAQNFYLKKR